jgi:3-carboxy-cis,cis-muconate cycloisomerase
MPELSELLYSTPAMSAAFSPEAHVRGMLAFEAALARAEARTGIISPDTADTIAARCKVELFDVVALYQEAVIAATPAIPLVHMLRALVEEDARKFVHWGAMSQDAIDTALMLQIRDGIDILVSGLLNICATCAVLAEQHRNTLMAGRTLLQQAVPITFGLKSARWLALAARQVYTLREHQERTLAVQLGGAAGTLASLGDRGTQVIQYLAEEHERAVGGWQAEWMAIPNLFSYTSSAVEHVGRMLEGLQVDTARMRANLELTGGLVMAESLTIEPWHLIVRLSHGEDANELFCF